MESSNGVGLRAAAAAAAYAGIALLVSAGARVLSTAPGIGDPEPGAVRWFATALACLGIAFVLAFGAAAFALAVTSPQPRAWTLPLAVAAVATGVGCGLFYDAAGADWRGPTSTLLAANQLPGAALVAAAPLLGLAAHARRPGGSRVLVAATALASVGWLLTLVVFAQACLDQ